jgi:hypothetical protein
VIALQAVLKAVTKRTVNGEDDDSSASSASASSMSSLRRGRESQTELDFHSGTLSAMEDETTVRNLLLLLAQNSQDTKIALSTCLVSHNNAVFIMKYN